VFVGEQLAMAGGLYKLTHSKATFETRISRFRLKG
jgi:hypothetical protein